MFPTPNVFSRFYASSGTHPWKVRRFVSRAELNAETIDDERGRAHLRSFPRLPEHAYARATMFFNRAAVLTRRRAVSLGVDRPWARDRCPAPLSRKRAIPPSAR